MTYGCVCGGRFKSYSVRTSGLYRLKYLRCDTCDGTTSVNVKIDGTGKELPTIVLDPSNNTLDVIADGRNDGSMASTNTQNGV
jgi:hypothetical protein